MGARTDHADPAERSIDRGNRPESSRRKARPRGKRPADLAPQKSVRGERAGNVGQMASARGKRAKNIGYREDRRGRAIAGRDEALRSLRDSWNGLPRDGCLHAWVQLRGDPALKALVAPRQ